MKRIALIALIVLGAGTVWRAKPVHAQTVTPRAPTAPPTGKVSGKVINQNEGTAVTASQEVMLHVWDEQNNEINMLHAQSSADGSFLFAGVDLEPQYAYGTMAVFDGVTYLSRVQPPTKGSDALQLDVPVYETTQQASGLQIDQMHVLFEFDPDGLQTTEIFAISNTGDRTVKDAVKLAGGKTATMRYPLPKDADYIFFQPDTQDRFMKLAAGFADTSPMLPGREGDRFAVQYMVPYSGSRSFDYTAPVNIKAMNFLLPQNSGVRLNGEGLAGPQPVTLDAGKSYEVYSLADVRAGQTFRVSISGQPAKGSAATRDLRLPIELGVGLLGFVMIGTAVWWWKRPDDYDKGHDDSDAEPSGTSLEGIVSQIALLDEAHERGELDDARYQSERSRLREEAHKLLIEEPPQ